MNLFDPLGSAQEAFWSLFVGAPAGFVAQCFVDPQATVANPAPQAQPQPVTDLPAFARNDASNREVPTTAPAVMPLVPLVPDADGPQWSSGRFEHGGEIAHHALGLLAYAALDDLHGRRVERNLP
jgi:hypothetical protein